MDVLRCPDCDVALLETRSSRSVLWTCPSCKGRCLGYSLLRRTAERAWAGELWGDAVDRSSTGSHLCPSCRAAMLVGTAGALTLDVCRSCHMVWFDPGEYERAPVIAERGARTLPQDALEKIAREKATVIAAEYKIRYGRDMTIAEALTLVPGITGLPLEEEKRSLSRWPWVTWATALMVTILGLWSLARPEAAEALGLVATEIDRLGGGTLVTALLVHVTLFQLMTNVYFLVIFGDNVEDFLGAVTFGVLLIAGGIAGNGLHAIFASDNSATLMGASGAVSAVTVFYAARFPTARLRYMRLLRWHTMPAAAGLLLWFVSKVASTQAFLGRAEPSAWPYVGGAVIGLIFWRVMRDPVR